MTTAIYPGSFDPVTNGHLDIITRASKLYDKVIVAVSNNIKKKSFLDKDTRINLLTDCVKNMPNVEVIVFDGLTVNLAEKTGASVIIRGMRNPNDFLFEQEMAQINKNLNDKIETVFLFANPIYASVSSSAVREILSFNGDISKLVPSNVCKYLENI